MLDKVFEWVEQLEPNDAITITVGLLTIAILALVTREIVKGDYRDWTVILIGVAVASAVFGFLVVTLAHVGPEE